MSTLRFSDLDTEVQATGEEAYVVTGDNIRFPVDQNDTAVLAIRTLELGHGHTVEVAANGSICTVTQRQQVVSMRHPEDLIALAVVLLETAVRQQVFVAKGVRP